MDAGLYLRKSSKTWHDEIHGDIDYGYVYPAWSRFVLPGDTWKIRSSLILRYMPMVTPPFTESEVRVRFGFVPLRLLDENTELIITGSKEGHYDKDLVIPEFPDLVTERDRLLDITDGFSNLTISKGSLLDWVYGLPEFTGNARAALSSRSAPAAYWLKAFSRFLFDYFRDENFCEDDDFVDYYKRDAQFLHYPDLGVEQGSNFFANLRKDGYITSALPWQLKGIAPTISPISGATVNFTGNFFTNTVYSGTSPNANISSNQNAPFFIDSSVPATTIQQANENMRQALAANSVDFTTAGFNMAQFREMVAQTRIFERLARTGSRYTEYLRANFGTAPADETLQRAEYLGGYKIPIVTTEVLQTAADGGTPVGTMRGHGITNGGDRIRTCHFKEFGVILATLDVRPRLAWTQGIDREKTYKSRWDFYNPSFQHLSEQEVRNGEVYFSYSDGLNDDVFGFVPYAQELRTGRTRMAGEMRGNLAQWNQAITFGSRPNLNQAFLQSTNYLDSWHRPFAVTDGHPMLLDFAVDCKVVRPMAGDAGVPGLVDHN